MTVIDTDTHIIESEEIWDRMDPGDRQLRPQAATTTRPDGREQKLWLTQGHSVPRGGVGPTPQIS